MHPRRRVQPLWLSRPWDLPCAMVSKSVSPTAKKKKNIDCRRKPSNAGFRVALTGTALELDAKFEVVKKLKLVGYPDKIFKKTAFIKGMFNSDLEVYTILVPFFFFCAFFFFF